MGNVTNRTMEDEAALYPPIDSLDVLTPLDDDVARYPEVDVPDSYLLKESGTTLNNMNLGNSVCAKRGGGDNEESCTESEGNHTEDTQAREEQDNNNNNEHEQIAKSFDQYEIDFESILESSSTHSHKQPEHKEEDRPPNQDVPPQDGMQPKEDTEGENQPTLDQEKDGDTPGAEKNADPAQGQQIPASGDEEPDPQEVPADVQGDEKEDSPTKENHDSVKIPQISLPDQEEPKMTESPLPIQAPQTSISDHQQDRLSPHIPRKSAITVEESAHRGLNKSDVSLMETVSTTSSAVPWNPYGNGKVVGGVATISPGNTLEFCVAGPNVQPTDIISIKSNLPNKNVAFKVKTTTLGRYKVRPAIGIVKPNETIEVIITLEEKIEDPAHITKDKFLVICQEVDPDVMLSQVSDLIRAVPKDLQTEHRLKVVMSKAESYSTPRKTEANHTALSSKNDVSTVGGKQLNDIQRKLERICSHNAQLESRLSAFGKIMFVQCCLMLVLIYLLMSNYWNRELPKNSQCKPWSLQD